MLTAAVSLWCADAEVPKRRCQRGGAEGRGRDQSGRSCARPLSSRAFSTRSWCAAARAPSRTHMRCTAERSERSAGPSWNGRSVRFACARTFADAPTADGMRLLDPIEGPDKPDFAARGQCGAVGGRSPTAAFLPPRHVGRCVRRVAARRSLLVTLLAWRGDPGRPRSWPSRCARRCARAAAAPPRRRMRGRDAREAVRRTACRIARCMYIRFDGPQSACTYVCDTITRVMTVLIISTLTAVASLLTPTLRRESSTPTPPRCALDSRYHHRMTPPLRQCAADVTAAGQPAPIAGHYGRQRPQRVYWRRVVHPGNNKHKWMTMTTAPDHYVSDRDALCVLMPRRRLTASRSRCTQSAARGSSLCRARWLTFKPLPVALHLFLANDGEMAQPF